MSVATPSSLVTPGSTLAIVIVVALAVLAYFPGLNGPFLFDDTVHITRNELLRVPDLSWESLQQLWHGSLFMPPIGRPLAMLTFGLQTYWFGGDSLPFKLANLSIHIASALLILLLARRLAWLALTDLDAVARQRLALWAGMAVMAAWALNPLQLTNVLYVVQRMNQISTLFVLLGMWLYVEGRYRLSFDRPWAWILMLGALPMAGLGMLGKENAALFPLYLAVLELTLLANLPKPARHGTLRAFQALVILLPLAAGMLYFVTHLEVFLGGFHGRPFDVEQRLFTQARVLWFYLQLMFVPSPSSLGFFHDDFPLSQTLWQPWTTLPAIVAWLSVIGLALLFRRRHPAIAFGVLFYLAAHSLESGIMPLELVYEHRNYLPSLGPMFLLGLAVASVSQQSNQRQWLIGLFCGYVLILGVITYFRANDWRDSLSLTLSEVHHHPDSPRANFRAAKSMIAVIPRVADPKPLYDGAMLHLNHLRELDPENSDALLAKIVLNLHLELPPERAWIEQLVAQLPSTNVDPSKLTISHFSFLVRWQLSGNSPLDNRDLQAIIEAALRNPGFDSLGKAGLHNANRALLQRLLHQPKEALEQARLAVYWWPKRFAYHKKVIELLIELGQLDEAREALKSASEHLDQARFVRILQDMVDSASKEKPNE